MRCISSDVIVSGGISTTTSPSGRSSTPRSTAAARHAPAPAQAVGRAARARRRPSARAAAPRAPPAATRRGRRAARASSSERSRTLASTSHASISSRWRSATAAASAFPPYECPWYSVRSAEVGAEERVEHAAARDRRRHRRGSPPVRPLPRHRRSGRRPHCSDANSVPVRPKPVATSSQISSTSCVAARGAEPREAVGIGELHAGRALHERLDDHRRELATRARRPSRPRCRSSRDRRSRGARSTGKRSGSKMSVPKPPSPTESAPMVSPWYAPPNARNVRAAGDAAVRPVLERDLQRLLDRGRAVGRVEEVRVVDRHDRAPALRTARRPRGCRCRASSSARRGRAVARIASSSSGTRWPSVVTHSDEIASR